MAGHPNRYKIKVYPSFLNLKPNLRLGNVITRFKIQLVFKRDITERQGCSKKMTFGVIWVTVPKFVVFSSRSVPCLEIDVMDDAINLYIFLQLQISMSLNGGKLSLVTVFIEYFVVCRVYFIV